MKVQCRYCGKVIQARPCRGGDGTAIRAHLHDANGARCRGSFTTLDLREALDDEEPKSKRAR